MKHYLKKLLIFLMVAALALPMLTVINVAAEPALITVAKYEENLKKFVADSRFKNGATWGDGQRPKVNTEWGSWSCCAYCADFVAYVYGVNNSVRLSDNFYKYTDINDIKKGDIIYINDTAMHWFVVIKRNGNSLDVVEGNYGGKVRHMNDGYRIKDGELYDVKWKKSRPFGYGFHYKFADSMYKIEYNANGGTGSVASKKLNFGAKFSLPTSGVTYDGYDLCGWQVKRSDGKWYVGGTNGWVDEKTMNEKGLRAKVYGLDGKEYTMSSNWTTGVERDTTFTFYAYWGTDLYNVKCIDNYSGVNLLHDGAFTGELDAEWYLTRDESVLTLDIDDEVKRTDEYNTLCVTSLAAGKSGKDLGIRTLTSGSSTGNGYIGDDKAMILSFWAKADTNDVSMYIRWGYEASSDYKKVTFTTEWQYYTIRMDKEKTFGNTMHPYFDGKGKIWFSEMQLQDGTEATAFVNEMGSYDLAFVPAKGTYDSLPTPTRGCYTFEGWYTAASGGEKITSSTPIKAGNFAVFAHWSDKPAHTEVTQPAVKATCGSDGLTEGKYCKVCGEVLVEQETIAASGSSHSYTNAVDKDCNVCGEPRNVNYTGWVLLSGKWYYYENGSALANCWKKDSKGWVYLGSNGAMLTNAWCRDSKGWCYVGSDGYALTNCWKKDSVGWIWLDSEGSMTKSKWILYKNDWYYLDANGYMVSNCWKKDSKGWVYLGSSGAMLRNAWCRDSKGWCYVGSDGYALTNCWAKDSIGWIWLDSDGSMTKNKWISYNGVWYYLNANGYWVG